MKVSYVSLSAGPVATRILLSLWHDSQSSIFRSHVSPCTIRVLTQNSDLRHHRTRLRSCDEATPFAQPSSKCGVPCIEFTENHGVANRLSLSILGCSGTVGPIILPDLTLFKVWNVAHYWPFYPIITMDP